MAIREAVRIEGEKGLRDVCSQLPKRVEKKAFKAGITAAASLVVRAAKSKAPRQSGLLKKAIGKKIVTYRNGSVAGIVGARRDISGTYKGRSRVPANYIHLVNKGAKPHMVGPRRHPGAKAQPFLTDAYEETKAKAADLCAKRIRIAVVVEAVRLGRRKK